MKTVVWRQCIALVLLVLALIVFGESGPARAGEAPTDQEISLHTARKDLDRVGWAAH